MSMSDEQFIRIRHAFRVHREKRSKYSGFSKGLQSEGIPWGKI